MARTLDEACGAADVFRLSGVSGRTEKMLAEARDGLSMVRSVQTHRKGFLVTL